MGRSDSLIVLLKTVDRALKAQLDAALRDVGHGLPQQAVMVALLANPGASNAELARWAFVSPQSMGEVMSSLEAAGFVERRPDPENARVLRTTLTARGKRAVATAGAELAKVEERIANAMTAAERDQLQTLLRQALDALTCDEAPAKRPRSPRPR